MKQIWTGIQLAFSALGGFIGWFLGGADGFLYALIAFVVVGLYHRSHVRYCGQKSVQRSGLQGHLPEGAHLCAGGRRQSGGRVCAGTRRVLRTAVIFFYLSNEGVSFLENAGRLGLPIPQKLKDVLEQLHDKTETGKGGNE